jgi:hypothetical protein
VQNYESMLLGRLFQSDGGWLQAVYVAAMFAIVIWRRDRIVSDGLFRASYLFFAAALIVPHLVTPLIQMLSSSGRNGNNQIYTFIFASSLGPACYAGAVICGLKSMLPPRVRFSQPPPGPHPLD